MLNTTPQPGAAAANARSGAATETDVLQPANRRLLICGPPNVGKSLIFGRLTGHYVAVSNYPGTTVEIASGSSEQLPGFEIIDTPGAYSLLPISEEESVTRNMLVEAQQGDVVMHVVDAKNLRRMLPMTLELLELGLNVVLVLNMMDEARHLDVSIDIRQLGTMLSIPVVPTTATTGEGLDRLAKTVSGAVRNGPPLRIEYGPDVLQAAGGDAGTGADFNPTLLATGLQDRLDSEALGTFELAVRKARQAHADGILADCAVFPPPTRAGFPALLSHLTMQTWSAIPIAAAVLYFGVYKFVGQFGAGTLVDLIEEGLYEKYLTPLLTRTTERLIPWPILQDLFVHDYGVFTLGLRYAVALILPIVGTFFILFSVLEDSGYLPRLAYLLDRVFKKIGLNGRAVIPIILGFGCGTMATMVTRILETKRERVIATLLLGVAIPCSAQLGVILAMLAGKPIAFAAWCTVLVIIFLVLGSVAAHKLPGEAPAFYLELPPLRMPRIGNVLTKTYSRMHWYFLEILPLFLAASIVIWLGHVTGAFDAVIRVIQPVVKAMGLPVATAGMSHQDAATAFLFGFFRRDYGAAGLFDMQRHGLLDARQTFVSVLVITLFLPCIAQFFVMRKERGWRFALLTSFFILVFATVMGITANFVLLKTGWF
jgi:ferrous iron transport protein B